MANVLATFLFAFSFCVSDGLCRLTDEREDWSVGAFDFQLDTALVLDVDGKLIVVRVMLDSSRCR